MTLFTRARNLTRPLTSAIWLLAASLPAQAVILTVNNTANAGAGSLRQALVSINDYEEAVEIHFDIGSGPANIVVAIPLPVITKQVTIDGTTQPGYAGSPLITLNGGGSVTEGLRIRARNCTVRGLVLQNFAGDGLVLDGGGGHVVQGNFIGTDSAGLVGNGNGAAGLRVLNSSGNQIGGTAASQGNLISGNGIGVHIEGASSFGNLIQANLIGTTRSGTGPLPNTLAGVVLSSSASGNQIGGTAPGEGNRIAFNNGDGVQLAGAGTTGNLITRNAIFVNGGLGINLQGGVEDLFGVTANDLVGDGDTGPNNLQNFPQITSMEVASGATIVRGTLRSTGSRFFRIDVYRSGTKDSSPNGEGENYFGSATVGTDLGGVATFSVAVPGTYPYDWFSATATDLSTSDTSEFSAVVQANPGTLEFSAFTYAVDEDDLSGTKSITVRRTGGSYGIVTVDYATSTRFGTPGWASEGLACGGGADYVRTTGTLTFGDGDTADKTFSIPICNDTLVEGDEVFNATLSNTTGGARLDDLTKEASIFIRDDEVTISISDTSVSDNDCAPLTRKVIFAVTLSGKASRDVTVHYATSDGTGPHAATSPDDYLAASGTLTIPAGETTSTNLQVAVNCDWGDEGVEWFAVTLSDPVNARLARAEGRCYISDLRIVWRPCCIALPFHLSFKSSADSLYRLEYTPSLDANANWAPVPGAEQIQGTGQIIEVVDQTSLQQPQRFYRLAVTLLQGPPNPNGQ